MALDTLLKLAAAIKNQGGRLLLTGGQVRDSLLEASIINDEKPIDNLSGQILNFKKQGNFDLVAFGLDWLEILQVAQSQGEARLVFQTQLSGTKKPSLVWLKIGTLILEISRPREFWPDSEIQTFESVWNVVLTKEKLYPKDYVQDELKDDALGRDFKVNAFYYDLLEKTILDPLGSFADLKAKRVSLAHHFSLERDPLRVLRAMVLISRSGFTADKDLLQSARANWPHLNKVVKDRFWPEWARWSRSRWPHLGLHFLKDSGAIAFWPELAAMIGCPQNFRFHPEGDAWNHTVLVVQAMSELPTLIPERLTHWLMAALLHDVGKPVVVRFNENGTPITKNHPEAGVPVAKKFLRSIKTPEKIVAVVAKLTRWHMELAFKRLTTEGLRLVARKLAPESDLVDYWAMSAADWNGRRPRINLFPYSLDEYLSPVDGERTSPKPLLAGQDLIAAFSLTPGPDVGKLLSQLNSAYDLGEIKTREEALAWLKRRGLGQ
ncbi:MAG: HD domain-containing protein [Deltaproteobacteria bacterium]|jgi:tRNA nucleotidyltransferase (CCA-adding enzyme)|nr:HD domain-containing protein [Deltaproteobacteria bacterium]